MYSWIRISIQNYQTLGWLEKGHSMGVAMSQLKYVFFFIFQYMKVDGKHIFLDYIILYEQLLNKKSDK